MMSIFITFTDVFQNQELLLISDTVKAGPASTVVRDRTIFLQTKISWLNTLAVGILCLYHLYSLFQFLVRIDTSGDARMTAYANSMYHRFNYVRFFFQALTYPFTAVLCGQLVYVTEYKTVVLIAAAVGFSQIFLWNIGSFPFNTPARVPKQLINWGASFTLFGAALVPIQIELGLIMFINQLPDYPFFPLVIIEGFPGLVLLQFIIELSSLFSKGLYIKFDFMSTLIFDAVILAPAGFLLLSSSGYITIETI